MTGPTATALTMLVTVKLPLLCRRVYWPVSALFWMLSPLRSTHDGEFSHHGVEVGLGAAEVEAPLALAVVEEGEVIHRGLEVAVGGHLERGAGGRLRIGDQQYLGAKPGGGVGVVEVALLCGGARFEELTVLDDEGELPLGGWEEFALVVVHL